MKSDADITKEGFLIKLEAAIKQLDADMERIESEITRARARIKSFRQNRLEAIRQAVARVLPTLDIATLQAIENRFRGCGLSTQQFGRDKAEEERSIRGRYRNVENESREARVQKHDLMASHVRTTETDLAAAKESFKPLQDVPDLERLIEAGYGTITYALDRSLFKVFSPQWWNDWRAADEIVTQLKVDDWSAVLRAYEAQAAAVSTIEAALKDHEAERVRCEEVIKCIDERDLKLEKVTQTLLERYQTKLCSWIDTSSVPLPSLVPELSYLDAELKSLDGQIMALEEARGQLVGERTKLVNLKGRLRSSSKRVVPARFVGALSPAPRNGSRSAASPSSARRHDGGGMSHPYVGYTDHYSNGFIDGVVFDQMMDYFNDPPPSVPSYGGGGYSGGYSSGGSSTGWSHSPSRREEPSSSNGGGYHSNDRDSRGWS